MARSRWSWGIVALLLLLAGGATEAYAKHKVAFLPSTAAQALTRAWSMSIAYTLKWKLIEFQALDPMMKAATQATMMDDLISQVEAFDPNAQEQDQGEQEGSDGNN